MTIEFTPQELQAAELAGQIAEKRERYHNELRDKPLAALRDQLEHLIKTGKTQADDLWLRREETMQRLVDIEYPTPAVRLA